MMDLGVDERPTGIGTIGLMRGEHVFYDCEFQDTGVSIDPISIGMVSDRGQYYAVNRQIDMIALWQNEFLLKEVLPHLPLIKGGNFLDTRHPDVKPLKQIRAEVGRFVMQHDSPNLWSWYGAYDHVIVAQLFGRMVELPSAFPMQTDDLKTVCKLLGDPRVPEQQGTKHNALEDAKWHREIFRFLQNVERRVRFEELMRAQVEANDE